MFVSVQRRPFGTPDRRKVSADELLGLKPPPKVETPRQPPDEKRLWKHPRLVAQLPERDQRAVLRLKSA